MDIKNTKPTAAEFFRKFSDLIVEAEQSVTIEENTGFAKVEKEIAKNPKVKDPAAVAASIGRKKYGKEKFQKMAVAGKKKANESMIEDQNEKFNFEKEVKRIARLTSDNCHTAALIKGAKLLSNRDIEKGADEIYREQRKIGHLTSEMSNARKRMYDDLMHYANETLSSEDYDKFHSAF